MGKFKSFSFLFMTFENAFKNVLKTVNSVFGTDVNYTDSNATVTTIKGVFDNAFVEIQGVSTLKPILKIQLSDLPLEPVEGDLILINLSNYKVLDSQPDSFGASVLILEKI